VGDIIRFRDVSQDSGMIGHGGTSQRVHNFQVRASGGDHAATAALEAAFTAQGLGWGRNGWPTGGVDIVVTEAMLGDHGILYSVSDWYRSSPNILNPFSMHAGSGFRAWNRPGGQGGTGNTSMNGNQFSWDDCPHGGWYPGGSVEYRQGAFIRVTNVLSQPEPPELNVRLIWQTITVNASTGEAVSTFSAQTVKYHSGPETEGMTSHFLGHCFGWGNPGTYETYYAHNQPLQITVNTDNVQTTTFPDTIRLPHFYGRYNMSYSPPMGKGDVTKIAKAVHISAMTLLAAAHHPMV
jgi:hypothetical protein